MTDRNSSDLPDEDVLRAVEAVNDEQDCWAFTAWVADRFPDVPFKVVAAKLSKLSQRGLVTGCACGCRGDWEVTQKGRAFAGITTARRPNPMVHDYKAECEAFAAMKGEATGLVVQVDPEFNPDQVMGPGDDSPRAATDEERVALGLPPRTSTKSNPLPDARSGDVGVVEGAAGAEALAREYLEWADKPFAQREAFDGDYWEHLGDAYRDVTPICRGLLALVADREALLERIQRLNRDLDASAQEQNRLVTLLRAKNLGGQGEE